MPPVAIYAQTLTTFRKMQINTPSCMNGSRFLLVVISSCLACSTVSWYASKWVYDKPEGMYYVSSPYLISAVTTLIILANYFIIKKLLGYRRRLQRIEAYLMSPVISTARSEEEPCSMKRRGYAALYGSSKSGRHSREPVNAGYGNIRHRGE